MGKQAVVCRLCPNRKRQRGFADYRCDDCGDQHCLSHVTPRMTGSLLTYVCRRCERKAEAIAPARAGGG